MGRGRRERRGNRRSGRLADAAGHLRGQNDDRSNPVDHVYTSFSRKLRLKGAGFQGVIRQEFRHSGLFV